MVLDKEFPKEILAVTLCAMLPFFWLKKKDLRDCVILASAVADRARTFSRFCNHSSDRAYTAPAEWMKGKGRETIQFGCCYNYAVASSPTITVCPAVVFIFHAVWMLGQ